MSAAKTETARLHEQLNRASERIEQLQKEIAHEREFNISFLVGCLDGEFKKEARAKDDADLGAEANVWRRASEMLRQHAVNEFPAAQRILAAIEGTDKPPLPSHLLLIVVLLKLLADARGSAKGLQSEIIGKAESQRLSVVGLSKSNIEKMFAAAKKIAADHGVTI